MPADTRAAGILDQALSLRDAIGLSETVFAPDDQPAGVGGVSTAVLDGEVVLYHDATRMVHRLNTVTGSVWLLSDGVTRVGEMASELAEVFDVDESNLTPLIQESLELLATNGLLVGHEQQAQIFFELADQFASDGSRILPRPPDP